MKVDGAEPGNVFLAKSGFGGTEYLLPAHVLQAFQRVRQRCIEQFRVIVVIYKRAAAALARNQIFRRKVIQGGNPPASSMKRNTRYALALARGLADVRMRAMAAGGRARHDKKRLIHLPFLLQCQP